MFAITLFGLPMAEFPTGYVGISLIGGFGIGLLVGMLIARFIITRYGNGKDKE